MSIYLLVRNVPEYFPTNVLLLCTMTTFRLAGLWRLIAPVGEDRRNDEDYIEETVERLLQVR